MFKKLIAFYSVLIVTSACNRDTDEFNNNTSGYNHSRSVGAAGNDLLGSTRYKSLLIEIQYMPGYKPDQQAIDHLKSFLETFLNKKEGITISMNQIDGISTAGLSTEEIRQTENRNRTAFSSASTIAVYTLYTNGQHAASSSTLGIAYRNTSIALMGKTIHDNSGGVEQVSRTKLEATVLEHEMGHLLGLVDLGSPMQTDHKDTENGNHCNTPNCLMYYASENTDMLGLLVTGNIPQLDANCKADLKNNGGR